ncbi:MAG: hypothetical protein IJ197_01420 [Bacteroidaceae bacterium]|nr:hypothetical protein [Bacteroidaceae bacterium]
MTAERLHDLCSTSTEVQCLDGVLRTSDRFDEEDFLRWYAQPDTLTADQYWETPSSCALIEQNGSWRTELSSPSATPRLQYALKMLPGIPYNIYLIAAPLLYPDSPTEAQPKSKIRATQYYLEGGRTSSHNSETIELTYTGEEQAVLLFENIEVENDDFNYMRIESRTSSRERQSGEYTNEIALVGVVAVPQKGIEDGMPMLEEMNAQTVVVCYDLSGRRLARMQKGINLLRIANGTTRKVLLR